ncbi:glycosyltransferase family 39 protein [Inconstantimicrobium mannanitabidum]|uniref:glycosyltransferase family 39 protein n=1 Tax=Inconstantimicrobium mannanitabidum TaxID=1604901 RepID=UPI0021C3B07B|nr:glycosyltransferase family 39 protein [Clostridium sp. TW13]
MLLIFLVFTSKIIDNFKNKLGSRAKEYIFLPIMLIMFFIQLMVGYRLSVNPSWDFGVVYRQALELSNTSGPVKANIYFVQYPNNIGLLILLAYYFKLLSFWGITNTLYFAIVLNIFFIDAAIIFLFLICKEIWNTKKAFLVLILCFIFMPYYTEVPIFYTDTTSITFITAIIYLYVIANKSEKAKKKTICFVFIGVLTALGFRLKATVAIILVATIIHMIFRKDKFLNKVIYTLVIIIAFIISMFLSGFAINSKLIISDYEKNRVQFPYTHWVMMGLQDVGFYNENDVQFTMERGPYDKKKAANIEVIEKRVNDYGFLGMAKHLTKKAAYTWGDGTYFAPHSLKLKPLVDTRLHKFVLPKGEYYYVFSYYSQVYHLVILFLILIVLYKKIKVSTLEDTFLIDISVFGLLIFLLIWETISRYLFNFTPLLMIIAIQGLDYIKSIPSINKILILNRK